METIASPTPRATIAHDGPGNDRSGGVLGRALGDVRAIVIDELWKYRELVYQFTLRNIRIRYKQAAMGFLWALFMPALVVAAGALVRFAMAYLGGGELAPREIAGMAIKALPWSFFVGAIGFGVSSHSCRPRMTNGVSLFWWIVTRSPHTASGTIASPSGCSACVRPWLGSRSWAMRFLRTPRTKNRPRLRPERHD